MYKALSVINSDQLNKYQMQFSMGALEGGLWDNAEKGIPMHLSHDMHKTIGWMMPYGLYFQPGLVRSLAATLIPDSNEEQQSVINAKRNHMLAHINEMLTKYEKDFFPYIQQHVTDALKYLEVNTLAAIEPGLTERMFPSLVKLQDDDGLIEISELLKDFEYKEQGVFFHRKLPICIFAHQYFRKSLSRHNNFHFFFLDALLKATKNPNVKTKIAIDPYMVGFSPSFNTCFEFEYWFGPKFNNDISCIQPGLTKHESSKEEKMFHGVSSSEFVWKINDDLHEFEMEELREDVAPTMGNTFACRYIHSIYSDTNKTFIHFDGAIRAYDSDLYFERIGMKMTEFGRRSQYTKIFRIDGKLDLCDWKSLSLNYMQGNPLVHEYFGETQVKSQTTEPIIPKTAKQEFVPFSIGVGDGIRMLLSYFPKNTTHTASHIVSIFNVFGNEEERINVIDYDIIEVKKALQRNGKTLVIPDNVSFIYAKDKYWNIPCIFHGNENPQEDISATIYSLSQIISSLIKKKRDSVISFTIAWNMEEKEIRLSVMGHIDDLSKWLTQCGNIPANRDEMIKWLEKQRTYLNNTSSANLSHPEVADICQLDGVLYMKRITLTDEFKWKLKENDNEVGIEFEIPKKHQTLYEEMVKQNIRPVISFIIKKKTCLKTQLNYLQSPYSSILDEGIITSIDEVDFVHPVWSDKAFE